MSKKAAKGLKNIGKLDTFDLSGRRRRRKLSHEATQAASAASAAALAKQQEEADKLASDKEKQNKKNQGYDAQNEEYVDMFAKGIIDPVKVVRTALQDAASIAGYL